MGICVNENDELETNLKQLGQTYLSWVTCECLQVDIFCLTCVYSFVCMGTNDTTTHDGSVVEWPPWKWDIVASNPS